MQPSILRCPEVWMLQITIKISFHNYRAKLTVNWKVKEENIERCMKLGINQKKEIRKRNTRKKINRRVQGNGVYVRIQFFEFRSFEMYCSWKANKCEKWDRTHRSERRRRNRGDTFQPCHPTSKARQLLSTLLKVQPFSWSLVLLSKNNNRNRKWEIKIIKILS